MVNDGLERRSYRVPEQRSGNRSEQRADDADERAVGGEDEPQLLLGRADGSEHAELAQAAVGNHRETGGSDQRDEDQEDARDREDRKRARRLTTRTGPIVEKSGSRDAAEVLPKRVERR